MQPVGKIIKELRLKRGLSQEELAERINARFGSNINKGMISKWENGVGCPRRDAARHLALFFGVSLDFLLGIEDQEQPETLAAHLEGEEWTPEELEEIEKFKDYLRSKRKK